MKQNINLVSSLIGILFVSCSSTALAQTAVINYTARGWYDSTGLYNGLGNYAAGFDAAVCRGSLCNIEFRNYFVFDMSNVEKPIASATLELTVVPVRGFASHDPSENYELHDYVGSVPTLLTGSGGVSAFNDLGIGVVYGNRTMTGADNGTIVTIPLNSSAVAALNNAHGLFAFGGLITTLDKSRTLDEEVVFGDTGLTGEYGSVPDVTDLRLTLVPEPTSAVLFAFAAMIFGMQRSRKRSI